MNDANTAKTARQRMLIDILFFLVSVALIFFGLSLSFPLLLWIGALTFGGALAISGVFSLQTGQTAKSAESQKRNTTIGSLSLTLGILLSIGAVIGMIMGGGLGTSGTSNGLSLAGSDNNGNASLDLNGISNGGNGEQINDDGISNPFPELTLALPVNSSEPPKLIIPSLDIEQTVVTIPIKDGIWDLEGLDMNVGWLPTTGNKPKGDWAMALAAHVTLTSTQKGPFYSLQSLNPGTEIIYRLGGTDYVYELGTTEVVQPDDVERLYLQDGNVMILVTCTDWDTNEQSYANRVLVFAKLVREEATPG